MILYSIWCQTETQSNVQSSKIWIFREQVYNLLGSVTDWLLGSVSRLLGSRLLLWRGFLIDDTLEIFFTSAVKNTIDRCKE